MLIPVVCKNTRVLFFRTGIIMIVRGKTMDAKNMTTTMSEGNRSRTFLNRLPAHEPVTGVSTRFHGRIRPAKGIIKGVGIFILLCLLLSTGASAAGTKTAYLGDMVTLSGSSPGSDIVYLFMTGPNLPVNGVALDNINRRADTGSFTTTDVDPDGHWTYKWYTSQLGGKIDTGTYTVWITDRPVDRSHLSGSEYTSISVTLKPPGISAVSSTATGTLDVRTVPEKAVITLNGESRGVTPVTIPDVPVGDVDLGLSSPGYENLTTRVAIQEGAVTEVHAILTPASGTLSVNTKPPGAEIFIDRTMRGVSPLILSNMSPGNYTLEIRKEGFNSTTREVMIIGGRTVAEDLSLGAEIPVINPTPPPTRAAGLLPALVLSLIAFMILAYRQK